jgi:hypothetical protein
MHIHISDNSNSGKCPYYADAGLYAAKEPCALTTNTTTYIHVCAINDPPILTVPSPDKLVLEEGQGDLEFALYIQDADASVYPDMQVEIQFESRQQSRGVCVHVNVCVCVCVCVHIYIQFESRQQS